jgi:hypothetical protein
MKRRKVNQKAKRELQGLHTAFILHYVKIESRENEGLGM